MTLSELTWRKSLRLEDGISNPRSYCWLEEIHGGHVVKETFASVGDEIA